jgi:hypothetical protein
MSPSTPPRAKRRVEIPIAVYIDPITKGSGSPRASLATYTGSAPPVESARGNAPAKLVTFPTACGSQTHKADSSGRRNTIFIRFAEEVIEYFCRSFPTEGLARSVVDHVSDGIELIT